MLKILNLCAVYMAAWIALSGCKSLQHLSARDSSASGSHADKSNKKNVTFIDGIAVYNGSTPAQPYGKTSVSKSAKIMYAPPTDVVLTNFNIENATALQFKYAVMLDASVEKLANIVLLQNIDYWYGTRYCLGGATENCIDCSAFTQIMMRDVYKAAVPRTARAQYDNSVRVEMENLQEGDLVFFQTLGNDISHVGIYLTNNKFVHAATSGGVMLSDLNDAYWRPKYKGAGRVAKQVQDNF